MRAALLAMAAFAALTLAAAASAGDLEDRGRYLVTAADCQPCHTKEGKGQPFAGGRAVPTPFGTLYSANITPDKDTGIGNWTPDQFYRAMHEGIDDQGHHLYPAFPYNYFTHMPKADTDAILAYLKTLPPVKQLPTRNQLSWPFSMRWLMWGWNLLFLDKDEFKPDPKQSQSWNRGAYLVQVVGHCGACHTPMNQFGAPKHDEAFQGGHFDDLFAPDLTGNQRVGLGRWKPEDIVAFLKTGRNRYANASAEMGEVVENSTSKMSDDDLKAIAEYLKGVASGPDVQVQKPPQDQMALGGQIFEDTCSACHEHKAEGVPTLFPPLAGSAEVQQKDSATLVHIILAGTRTASTDEAPTASSMPSYDWKLTDDQIAAVATYIRNAWGNSAPAVTPREVSEMRKKVVKPEASANDSH
jgi:mono/diheme cytochrome c family protein